MRNIEVSLKEILVYILRRWKPIIALALVLAFLLGGYAFLQQDASNARFRNVAEPTGSADSVQVTDKTFDSVSRSTTLSLSIDLTNVEFVNDITNYATQARNDAIGKLIDRYLIIARSAPLTQILKNVVPEGLNENELSQFVKVESPAIGIISVITTTDHDTDSQRVAEAVYDYLLSQTESLSASVSEHKISALASFTTLSTPEPIPQVTPQPDPESAPASAPIIAVLLKKAIMGFVIGLLVGILTSAYVYLTLLPVQIPEQIQRQLDVRYLGGVRREKRGTLGGRLAGSLRMGDERSAMEIITANLREFAPSQGIILVTGTISERMIVEFVESLSSNYNNGDVRFSYGADVNRDAKTIAKLADSNAVIFVERLDTSRMKHVYDEKQRIDMSGKEILGYVLY